MTVGQTDFREAILDPGLAVPMGLVDPQGRAAGKRFDVYRNNVVVSLSRALAEAFPVIAKLLGDNNFGILARAFVRRHPPASPLIATYGQALPAFLADFEPVRHLGYLPDVARLELALRQSYHAADSTAIDPGQIQRLPADRLMACRFAVAPALRIVVSDWPVVSIWRFNAKNGPKPEMRAETALITRPEFDPVIGDLTRAGAAFVEALATGRSLAEAYGGASDIVPDFDLVPVLGALISGGALTGILEEASL